MADTTLTEPIPAHMKLSLIRFDTGAWGLQRGGQPVGGQCQFSSMTLEEFRLGLEIYMNQLAEIRAALIRDFAPSKLLARDWSDLYVVIFQLEEENFPFVHETLARITAQGTDALLSYDECLRAINNGPRHECINAAWALVRAAQDEAKVLASALPSQVYETLLGGDPKGRCLVFLRQAIRAFQRAVSMLEAA